MVERNTYNLINRPQKKYEKSIIIAGGVSYNGVGKLMVGRYFFFIKMI